MNTRITMKLHEVLVTFGLVLAATMMATAGYGQNDDLPYDSGSTGADGHLGYVGSVSHHAMTYDGSRGHVIMFGGWDGSRNLQNTWEYNGANWVPIVTADAPTMRREHAMAYDSVRGRTVLFGGYDDVSRFQDTWEFDGANWQQVATSAKPTPRNWHRAVFDAARGKIVLFGGFDAVVGPHQDTWEYDGADWVEVSTPNKPPKRQAHMMAFDAARETVVVFGGLGESSASQDTWEYDGSSWTEVVTASRPSARYASAMSYDESLQRVVLFGGSNGAQNQSDTWEYDGTNWSQIGVAESPDTRESVDQAFDSSRGRTVMFGGRSGANYRGGTFEYDGTNWELRGIEYARVFDMSARADGIWNFLSVYVGRNATVTFKKNVGNTPVQWFASDHVVIDGMLDLDGEGGLGYNTAGHTNPGREAKGGPGGFDGGLGGTRGDSSGSYAGTPGLGPGGGLPGTTDKANGSGGGHTGVYGNGFLQPLIGGSGGGGGASGWSSDGANGGAGGGAILIASSRDITVDGTISARGGLGGQGFNQSGSWKSEGGDGSGGAIRLVADRVEGNGSLDARGSTALQPQRGGDGRIRIEGYYRQLAANASPPPSVSAPTESLGDIAGNPALLIASVNGEVVASPPTGSLVNPDVVFSDAGTVAVVVSAVDVPDGTPVSLRIIASGQVIDLPQAGVTNVLAGGTATFQATVPAGLGHIQAFAEFTPLP